MVTEKIRFEMSWYIYRSYYHCPVNLFSKESCLYIFNPWEVDTIVYELTHNLEVNNAQRFLWEKDHLKINNILSVAAGFQGGFHRLDIAVPIHINDINILINFLSEKMISFLVGMLIQQLPIKLVTEDELPE